jgi:AraC family transcriptional regulator, regulatory protein of adaptative response / DNA-3-methyladenine glycosylase II
VDDDARYEALLARDRRFDGVFFVGVATTGIYCRPVCPARTPGRARCTFYDSAARAEAAGFRACLRCRPELAPGHAEIDAVDGLVTAAIDRIAEGALNEGSVDELASELGVSGRHLRRALEARLGVSPVQLAQTRRLALAKQLLHDTRLSVTEIAFAAGYRSVRRFNAAFAATMGSPPSAVRRDHGQVEAAASGAIALRLDVRPPYDWDAVLAFLAARAIPGVESVAGGWYRRIVHVAGVTGAIAVCQRADRPALELVISPRLTPVVMPLVARVRRLFDLDARPDVIARVLGRDRVLAPLVAARPGLRVPGAIDAFEAAVRALLGQQVSVAAATTLAGRFAAAFGTPAPGESDGLAYRFPTAAEIARVSPAAIAAIGLPGARAQAIHELARAIVTQALPLAGELERFVAAAVALPGIGPWTAHYLAMRALHLPDAFPASDLGVRKALTRVSIADVRAITARAEAWRPFRAYAVMHLWCSLGGSDDATRVHDDRLAARRAPLARARRRARGGVPAGASRPRRTRGEEPAARRGSTAARRVLRRRTPGVRAADRSSR